MNFEMERFIRDLLSYVNSYYFLPEPYVLSDKSGVMDVYIQNSIGIIVLKVDLLEEIFEVNDTVDILEADFWGEHLILLGFERFTSSGGLLM